MSKKTRRRRKPTARPERMKQLAADTLAGTVSGLITAAILKLLDCYRPGVRATTPHPKYKTNHPALSLGGQTMIFQISLVIFVAVFVPLRRLFRRILKGGKNHVD